MIALALAVAAVAVLAAAVFIWRAPHLGAVLGNHDLTASLALFVLGGALLGAAVGRIVAS